MGAPKGCGTVSTSREWVESARAGRTGSGVETGHLRLEEQSDDDSRLGQLPGVTRAAVVVVIVVVEDVVVEVEGAPQWHVSSQRDGCGQEKPPG